MPTPHGVQSSVERMIRDFTDSVAVTKPRPSTRRESPAPQARNAV